MLQGNDLNTSAESAASLTRQLEAASGLIKGMREPLTFMKDQFEKTLNTVAGLKTN